MAIENLMNSQKTALLRPRVLQEARMNKISMTTLSAAINKPGFLKV